MTTQAKRLAEIRKAIDAENVSLGELSELQDIAATHPQLFAGDPVLAEAAGIPEEDWRQGLKPVEVTPGPWSVSFGERDASIYTAGTIASVDDTMTGWKANARLIAAAPDLLAALSRLAVWSDRLGPCFCGACDYMPGRPERHKHTAECDNARAAIAKAEGRAE